MHGTRKQLKLGQGRHTCFPDPETGLVPNPLLCLPTCQVMFPVFLGEPVSPEMLAATLAELDATLQLLEDKFLQNKAFLTGPHISLADLIAITELMHVSAMDRVGLLGRGGSWGLLNPCSRCPHCPHLAMTYGNFLELWALPPPNRQRLPSLTLPIHPHPVLFLRTACGCWLPSL